MMEEETKVVKKKKKKKSKNKGLYSLISFVLSMGLFVVSAFFLYKSVNEIYNTIILKQEISVSQEILDALKEETELLQNEKIKFEDPDYVVRYARGQYLLTKDGEKVFYLPSK